MTEVQVNTSTSQPCATHIFLWKHPMVWAIPMAGWAGVLLLWAWDVNRPLFIWMNALAAQAPAVWWSCLSLLGHTCAAFALLTPLLGRMPQALSAAMLAVLPASVYSVSLKRSFDELRPAAVLADGQFHLIGERLQFHAFPSGHTITAFALVGAVWASWPAAQRRVAGVVAWLLLAVFMGLSRIAVGAHWPMDVCMGAAGGWLSGVAGAWALQRWPVLDAARARFFYRVVLGLMCVSLFWVDSGYPLANGFQWVLAVASLAWLAFWVWAARKGKAVVAA
jgi:membrane-associated phospholipid phosphatase